MSDTKQLIEKFIKLSIVPKDPDKYEAWINIMTSSIASQSISKYNNHVFNVIFNINIITIFLIILSSILVSTYSGSLISIISLILLVIYFHNQNKYLEKQAEESIKQWLICLECEKDCAICESNQILKDLDLTRFDSN